MRKIVNDSIDIAAIDKQFAQMLRESNSRLEKIMTGKYKQRRSRRGEQSNGQANTGMKTLLREFKGGKISVQHINEQMKLLTMQVKVAKKRKSIMSDATTTNLLSLALIKIGIIPRNGRVR